MAALSPSIGSYGFEHSFIPDPLARRAARYLPRRGALLDVGCGEGADSVFYASKGFHVTAIDRNADYLHRFRKYRSDHSLTSISIRQRDATSQNYPRDTFDVISCLLVLCCMKRSEFDCMLPKLKRSVRPGGIIIMSSRNVLDPELKEYRRTARKIEPNTFIHSDDCCRYVYFIEKGRLRELFSDFEILYCFEGFAPCKYDEHPRHGDSYIICRRPTA